MKTGSMARAVPSLLHYPEILKGHKPISSLPHDPTTYTARDP